VGSEIQSRFFCIVTAVAISIACVSCRTEISVLNAMPAASNTYWSDLARFLGGMRGVGTDHFAVLKRNSQYEDHALWMDRYWDRVKRENVDAISRWREGNMPSYAAKNTVVYPLCGGDFVNLYTFFPDAKSYVMMSLEGQGKIPDPVKLTPGELSSGLRSIQRCINSIASVNYFVTRAMKAEMVNRYFDGTTPVLLVYAARLGLSVSDVRQIALANDGSVVEVDGAQPQNTGANSIKGTRIRFTTPTHPEQRELIYLSLRFKPTSTDENRPEGLFLRRLGNFNLFIKSAIYLLHLREYRHACEFFVSRGSLVIMDDSGIPYRYFTGNAWNSILYGFYDRPVGLREITNPPRQDDLSKAYRESNNPLPFKFGYGVLRNDRKSNLIMMVRNRPSGA
jgi:hypothetical protein